MGEKDLLGQPPRREICIDGGVVVILNPRVDEIPEEIRNQMAEGRGLTVINERGQRTFGWLPREVERAA